MGLTGQSVGRGALDSGLHLAQRGKDERVVALVGNPNVGKSTVFNALTGLHQHTGNWPGKTVTGAVGHCRQGEDAWLLVDTPGTYSLLARSAEEEVTRDFVMSGQADAVIVVCDAACLARNLLLVLQVMAVASHVIVCVNLLDEAGRRGIYPDLSLLQQRLGVPVVGTVARKRGSADALLNALAMPVGNDTPPANEDLLTACRASFSSGDEEEQESVAIALASYAEELCAAVLPAPGQAYSRRDRRLDRLLTGRYTAYPIMLALLLVLFFITMVGANAPSAWLGAGFSVVEDGLRWIFDAAKAPPWLTGILIDGVFCVLSEVVSVMLPPMAIFFPLFTLLEDSGYLPRIAYNLDRPFCTCRACGKQALTMCMGFGCNAAGVVGCRIIDSPRERLLAILTNSMVPCNGRFPALLSLIAMFLVGSSAVGLAASLLSALLLTTLILLGIGMTLLSTRLLSATILRGIPSSFTLELPPYRCPQVGRVLVRSLLDRTIYVLGRAAIVAVPAGCLIWISANLTWGGASLLHHAAAWLDPFASLFGMDGMIMLAFILGLPANEIVLPLVAMGYLSAGTPVEIGSLAEMRTLFMANGWTPITALCTAIFFLFHWPCSTTLLTIKKETGRWGYTVLSAILPTAIGLLLCMLIAFFGKFLL